MGFVHERENETDLWLASSAGQALLREEQRVTGQILQGVFGDQILQIGYWGECGRLLEAARTQFSAVMGDRQVPALNARMRPNRLAVMTDSIDAVLLPHTLELGSDPHGMLREVHRILRPDGKLIVLGFNPYRRGTWVNPICWPR